MDIIERRKKFWIINVFLFSLFLILSIYYLNIVNENNYVGIRAQKSEGDWYIKRIQYDGSAYDSVLSAGDKIVSIDNKAPEDNRLLKKWLLVEDIESISIIKDDVVQEVKLEEENLMINKYVLFWLIGFMGFVFLFYYINKKNVGFSGTLFYCFMVLTIFLIISVVPSSMGVDIARLIIILYVSMFPLFIDLFLKIYKTSIIYKKRYSYIVEVIIGIFNVIACIATIFGDVPYLVSEYLAQGIFGILALLLLFVFSNNRRMLVKEEIFVSNINVPMICMISFVPLFLLYLFPIRWDAPFVLVVPFIILPIMAVFHLLIISKLIPNRYKVSKRGFYVILSTVITVVVVVLVCLHKYVPIQILIIYCFCFWLAFMPLIDEFLTTMKRETQQMNSLQLFGAVEEERENISTYIHDTVIQDVIYSMKTIETMDKIDKKEILHILDEIIFYLRELCSDIYPLMIQEMGLKSALLAVINQIEKKHPVMITCNIQVEEFRFSLRKCNFILRSIKELINNSILHGKATEIELQVTEEGNYCFFRVRDNGKFKNQKGKKEPHFGLELIKEKVTLLNGEIVMEVEEETIISMKIPVDLKGEVKNEDCID